MPQEVQSIQPVMMNDYANYKKKSNVGKGALIGGLTTTVIGGGLAAYGYNTVGKELKALKNKVLLKDVNTYNKPIKTPFLKAAKTVFISA